MLIELQINPKTLLVVSIKILCVKYFGIGIEPIRFESHSTPSITRLDAYDLNLFKQILKKRYRRPT